MGSEARARLGLVALLGVTLLSFSQLFGGGDYPGPALLGMFAAAGIAIGARRIGAGTIPTLLASGAGLLWYLTFLFRLEDTFSGLPTPAAAQGLLDSLRRVIEHARVDYAPVPLRPGYVILIIVGMWVTTTIGELATFRWKRPLLASIPPVALFSIPMVVGTGDANVLLVPAFLAALMTYWGLESSHRLRSWGRWIPTWSDHQEEEPDTVTGGLARRMAASCIALALFAPLALPAVEDGFVAWRTGLGGGSGGGSGQIDPYVSIAPRLLNQTSTRLFTVQAEEPAYWRLVTLSRFDGEAWRQDEPAPVPHEGGTLPAELETDAPLRNVEQVVRIDGLRGTSLPAAGQATMFDLIEPEERRRDVHFDATDGDLMFDGDLETGVTYRTTSVLPDLGFRDLVGADIGDPGGDFTSLPDGTFTPEVAALRDQWVAGAGGPFQQLVAIQTRLRGEFLYSVENVGAPTSDLLSYFLLESRAGFCQHFATAFAVLARSLGYPTRVVVGFLPGEISTDRSGGYLVRGTDAHAWPEVYFEDIGWVPFEPTPRSDRVATAPEYTERQAAGEGPSAGPSEPNQTGGGEDGPGAHLDARALNDPQDDGQLSALELQELLQGGGSAADDPLEESAWEQTFARLTTGVLLLLLAYLVLVPALKALARRRRYELASGPREAIAAAYLDFEEAAAELAFPRSGSTSPRSYARSLSEEKGLAERTLFDLTRLFEKAEYGAREPDAGQAATARGLAATLKKNLWHAAPWIKRATRSFSPRSLVPERPSRRRRATGPVAEH